MGAAQFVWNAVRPQEAAEVPSASRALPWEEPRPAAASIGPLAEAPRCGRMSEADHTAPGGPPVFDARPTARLMPEAGFRPASSKPGSVSELGKGAMRARQVLFRVRMAGRLVNDPRSAGPVSGYGPPEPEPVVPPPAFSPPAGLTFPQAQLHALDMTGLDVPSTARSRPLGKPSFTVEPRVPQRAVGPVEFRFESPAPSAPVWAPLLEVWKAVPGLVRNTVLASVIIAVLALVAWSVAGDSIAEGLQHRAAIELSDGFRSGLSGWMGARDWSESWSYDRAGFMHVGQLALLRASGRMSDCRLELLGAIAGRSMGWVYRAADLDNYYAMQLVITKPGPLPSVILVRYVVIAGREEDRVQIPIRMVIRNNVPQRVRLEVKADGFTTSVNGQVVDFWRDDRLKAGAVGLFSEKDEQAQIYWIKVSHQDDFLGKLCAYLAPSRGENNHGGLR